ncbi:MAG: acyl-CoA dehydrogenase [Anaerolineaceae bacterium]|nr:MAG: acyl-CoA dehydrogenase [Anaerolineaceae bacterium]
MTTQNAIIGRNDLRAWEDGKPDNFFVADANLHHVLLRTLGEGRYAEIVNDLTWFGGECATTIDTGMKIEDRRGNHPRLERYNGIGERVEQIEFHPNHDAIGRIIWKSKIMALQAEPGNTVHQMALFYLLNHTADGHSCGLACTSGLIRALQQEADPAVRDKFLPPLLNPDYDSMQHGAQFLTEVQGGSDVGANAVVAVDHGDGTWRITGEKWFCSNINADQFLVMARPQSASDGTRGLAAFVVPRTLDDGTTNGFYLRRLKDKLGTRTLASAELDFIDAVAYPVGAIDRGFKITVELVLNTSRLMNAISCAGFMRRAYIEAASYACNRRAFGQVIAEYPLVQEAVADILAESTAAVASGFMLADLLDKIETGAAGDDERAIYRIFVNLNKYITSVRGSESIHRAIEVLGGNGAIESFSILPRLYRDMVVLESWEGAHNVLCLQVLRDIGRYGVHQPYIAYLQRTLDAVSADQLKGLADTVREAINRAMTLLGRIASADSAYQQAHARRLADALSHVGQAALLLAEAQWEIDNAGHTIKPDVAAYYINRRLVPGYDPMDDADYLQRLARLMTAY